MHECWPSGGSSQTVEQRECPATCLSSVHSHRRPERHTVCGACHRSAVPASTGTSIRECAWQQSTGPTASPRIRAPSTARNPTSSPACTTSTCLSRGSGWGRAGSSRAVRSARAATPTPVRRGGVAPAANRPVALQVRLADGQRTDQGRLQLGRARQSPGSPVRPDTLTEPLDQATAVTRTLADP